MKEIMLLIIAIFLEVIASTALKISNGFSILLPSIFVVVGYLGSFYLLGLTLKRLPLSVTYASWAGGGTALTALVGIVLFDESAEVLKFLGLALAIAGLILLNTQNKASSETESL
ncbi:small multidrug resistance pump/multidrug resistance protein EbrB [Terribacillus halophilus]|uniref:Small multidrug resistance pump/multidrug resistance protein EbrB n=1 Tax=Terribacillus halophilus TaxID=361279 RepID=A0A1G6T1G3_9BACI|nr:multidrug efflux SMR transporter [Terribacillus halophilus]SDD22831.1 small multidrug resistance pump/multidrug resistance protein EbrB [Terribacillus halophilus]